MSETKEKILLTALHLFAVDGYEAVSVSRIAGELHITKGALYRHYESKRDIFEQIVSRMEKEDALRAARYGLPTGTPAQTKEAYRKASLEQIAEFTLAQFSYWTQEDFSASFRKMLTLEQYRSNEMQQLYQQYLVSGPLQYITDLFLALDISDAREKAISFYAPISLFYTIFDGSTDRESVKAECLKHVMGCMDNLLENNNEYRK